LERHVSTDKSSQNSEKRGSAPGQKAPIVNRRMALGMAFRRAVSAVVDARAKTITTIVDAAEKMKSSGEK
jgi:hypothetical protein